MADPYFRGDDARYAGLDLLATAVLLLDGGRRIVYANAAAENLFALSRKQLVNRTPHVVFNDAGRLEHAFEQAIRQHGTYTEQELELSINGRLRLHLSCTVTPLDVGDNLLLEFRQIDQQIKNAREERQLEQAQANRELIRNLAHEIKNPLGGIRGAAQLLERELPDAELREFTQVIVKEADRLQSLMNRLLTPNRLPRVELLNIHEVTERVRTLLLAEFPGGLSVQRDYDTSLPELAGDKEQLIQAILNVARNGAQAMEGRGAIRFVTRIARQVTIARNRFRHALAVSVEDDGPGVPPHLAERIFYPLVSGREGGTGLGLSLAQSFVSQHHGLIEFESVPGRTRFTILLPVTERAAA